MRIELNSRFNQAIFLLAALLPSLLFAYQVQNHYRAATAAEDISQIGLEKAVRLEPGSAENRDLLGRFYLYALQDGKKADAEFAEAVRLDPHSSRYWLDLATAKGLQGQTDAQRSALQHALAIDPKTPKVAWEAGNFFLLDGNTEAALDSFKTSIQNDPLAVYPALQLCWRATHDVDTILAHAMPPLLQPHLELLRITMEQRETASAMKTWRALVALNQPFKVADTMPFIEYLILQHEIAAAQEAWTGMQKMSASLRPSTSDGSLIVNGNFDEEIIPGGFSWMVRPPAVQTIRIDANEFHAGNASVSFTFEGPTFSDYGFSQVVPVKPNQLYELRVNAKSQEITSAEGPRMLIEDAFNHLSL